MRIKLNYKTLFCLILAVLNFSCSDFEIEAPEGKIEDKALYLNYQIENKLLTYAVTAETHECEVKNIYCFFFNPETASVNAGKYQFYTKSLLNENVAQASLKLLMPDDVNKAWKILVVANLDQHVDLGAASDLKDWIKSKLTVNSTDFEDAKSLLTVWGGPADGFKSPLPMTGEFDKAQGVKRINVKLQRRVARIDIINNDPGFSIESVELRNARLRSALWGEALLEASAAGDYINYSNVTPTVTSQNIIAKHYSLPNFVMNPDANDTKTTMLIVKGKLNNGVSSYYRLNVNNKGDQHILRPNGVYVVTITKVNATGGGSDTGADSENIEYYVNERIEEGEGAGTTDSDGNKLTVSKQYVGLAPIKGDTDKVEVITKLSTTNAIVGPWTFDVVGEDKDKFTVVEEKDGGNQKFLKITAKNDNLSDKNYYAQIIVKWGNISQPIYIAQIGKYAGVAAGISVTPAGLFVPARKEAPAAPTDKLTRKLIVQIEDVIGNIDVNKDDASTAISFQGSGALHANWFLLSEPEYNATKLTFTYTLTADPLPTELNIRRASIEFKVKVGDKELTTQAQVFQAETGLEAIPEYRAISVGMFEKNFLQSDYRYKSAPPACYSDFHGFDANKLKDNHLQFSLNDKDYMYYELNITSSDAWEIEPDAQVRDKISFLNASGVPISEGSGGKTEVVRIKAKSDLTQSSNPQKDPWDGTFKIKFANNLTKTVHVYQEGITQYFKKHAEARQHGTYFYKTKSINNKEWLDRPIAAKSEKWFDMALGRGDHQAYDKFNGISWKDRPLSFDAQDCPKGFKVIPLSVYNALSPKLKRKETGPEEGQIYFQGNNPGEQIPLNVAGVPGAFTNYYLVGDDVSKNQQNNLGLAVFGCQVDEGGVTKYVDVPTENNTNRRNMNLGFVNKKLSTIVFNEKRYSQGDWLSQFQSNTDIKVYSNMIDNPYNAHQGVTQTQNTKTLPQGGEWDFGDMDVTITHNNWPLRSSDDYDELDDAIRRKIAKLGLRQTTEHRIAFKDQKSVKSDINNITVVVNVKNIYVRWLGGGESNPRPNINLKRRVALYGVTRTVIYSKKPHLLNCVRE